MVSEKINDAIEFYKANSNELSLAKIARMFDIDRTNFSNQLKRRNVQVINKQNETKFNQHAFDSIDTEEKAYWLGFLFADGWVSSIDNTIGLDLAIKDKDHLNKFIKFLEFKKEKVCRLFEFRCRFSVANEHLKQTLITLGCIPRKSLILDFPDKNIFSDLSLIRHFIRGYFDGDGCITYNDKEHTRMSILLLGTKSLLEHVLQYSNFIRKIRKINNIHQITITRKNGLSFLHWLYKDSIIYLDRKHLRYIEYCRLYEGL